MKPYEHLTREQLRIRAQLFLEEGWELLEEIDRRDGIAPAGRKTRSGLRVIDGGES